MDEFHVIDRFFRPLARGFAGALELRDDAAFISPPPGMQCVITTDMLQEGVHFFGHEKPSLIAKKALRVNLSDLAAKGAMPHCYFLTLGLDETITETWMADFAKGLEEDQAMYGIALAGGDTTRSKGTISISITAIGLVAEGKMLCRSGATPGDHLYVSGTIGDSAIGLALLKQELSLPPLMRNTPIERYYLPQPKIGLIPDLRYANAAMDISDGLFQDTRHLLEASGIGAEIRLESIPVSKAMQMVKTLSPSQFLPLMGGGDDYEILCSAPVSPGEHWTEIGIITPEKGLRLIDAAGSIIPAPSGYQHHLGRVVGP